MSQFYIKTKPEFGDPEVYQLSCTTEMSINLSNSVSKNPMVSRRNIADNTAVNSIEITASGVITNVRNYLLTKRSLNDQRTVSDNFYLLKSLQESGDTFELHLEDQLNPLDDCVFKSLTFTKNSGQGTSYDVNMTITQIVKSTQISSSNEKFERNVDVQNQSGSKTSSGSTATKDEGNLSRALLNGFIKTVSDVFVDEVEE